MKKTKIAFLTFEFVVFGQLKIFEQLLFLNNGVFSQIFFTAKETKRFFFYFFRQSDDHKNFERLCFVFEQLLRRLFRF
jgi:hypothetical protein